MSAVRSCVLNYVFSACRILNVNIERKFKLIVCRSVGSYFESICKVSKLQVYNVLIFNAHTYERYVCR